MCKTSWRLPEHYKDKQEGHVEYDNRGTIKEALFFVAVPTLCLQQG